jgi:putative RNA 2'-phosphotransferase
MEKLSNLDFDSLSKEIAFALRHNPDKYELKLDNGWVSLIELSEGLKKNGWKT